VLSADGATRPSTEAGGQSHGDCRGAELRRAGIFQKITLAIVRRPPE